MAPPAGTLRVGRYFLVLLGIFAVLYGLVFFPGARHAPKLGLDLQGGKQVVYEAKAPHGKAPSKSAMSQARQIMEDRVNGSGVAQAEVVVQGTNQISVSIPGKSTKDISKLGQAAQLNFRPVVMPPVAVTPASTPTSTPSATTTTPSTTTTPTTTPTPPTTTAPAASPRPSSSPASGQNAAARPLNAPSSTAPTSPTASSTPRASAAPTPTPSAAPKASDPFKGLTFALPKSDTEYNKLTQAQQQELQARLASYNCGADQPDGPAQRTQDFIACSVKSSTQASNTAFLLGPIIVPGTEISSASAVAPNFSGSGGGSAQWTVSLSLKSSGSSAWANYTGAHNTKGQQITTSITQCGPSATPCADYVAFTLDGAVISAPYNQDAINGQATQISGGFNQSSASQLARELKYGALPLSFTVLTNSDVSATLGTAQLKAGLLAGGIGLILVVLYSLVYYRALGLITIASLLVSGVLTYACLVILGREIGFTLTLAGIAGFIVAVGITADSFVVFFERLKDEVHGGRSMRVAVPRGWVRARRTILSADTVSFLAAAVLYYFAAGDVKGFAFTLGLSTILDLVVVFLFTHPMVSLLSRSAAFGSARFTGLNAARVSGAPEPEAEPAAPPRGARRAKAAGRSGERPAPVVLLDDEDVEPAVDESALPPPEPDAEAPERASARQAGTAAERAAARRARLRAQAGDRGEGKR